MASTLAPPSRPAPPPISGATRDLVCREIVLDTENCVKACSGRDDKFETQDLQLRGDPYWAGQSPRWQGGSEYEEPVTREHHTDQLATLMQAYRTDQIWTAGATAEQDEQAAADYEAFLNGLIPQYDLVEGPIYDLGYNSRRHGVGYLWCGWAEATEDEFETQYRDPAGNVVPEDALEEGVKYERIEVSHPEVRSHGLDLRVCNTADVYFSPPNAPIDKATRIAERVYLTAHDLLDGIEAFNYDEEVVAKILDGGSQGAGHSSQRKEKDEQDGITPSEGMEGFYECFLVVGRPPVMWEGGKSTLTAEERTRDYLWMFERSTGECFRFDPLPYKTRPYIRFGFLDEPGREIGDGVCSLLSGLQVEGSIAGRFRLDVRDLAMSPALMVPAELYDLFKRFPNYPGALWPLPAGTNPAMVQPLKYDAQGFLAAMQDSQDFRLRSAQMFSTQARGSVTHKERTAEEVGNAAAGADAKTDLFLGCFARGLKEFARVATSHYRQFMDRDGEEMMVGQKVLRITPDLLAKRFHVGVIGSSESSNPSLRMQRMETVYTLLLQSPILQMQLQRGDLTGAWALTSRLLRASGTVRDPQTIIGKEPAKPPSDTEVLEALLAAIQQYAASGDPNMGMLMQQVQGMMASRQPEPPGMTPIPWDQGQPSNPAMMGHGLPMLGMGEGPAAFGLPEMQMGGMAA